MPPLLSLRASLGPASRVLHPAPAPRASAFLICIALLPALLSTSCRVPEDWAALNAAINLRFPSVEHVTTAELARWMAQPDTVAPLLLDVRDPAEYAISHLIGASLAPDLTGALAVLAAAPADTPIVVYCSVGHRSAELADELGRAGYTQARNLEGSIFQWANEGRPLFRGASRTETVHPYGARWQHFLDPERRAALP